MITSKFINTLYSDSAFKEKCLSKLEIMFDDERNEGIAEFNDLMDDKLEYGKRYTITISVEEAT